MTEGDNTPNGTGRNAVRSLFIERLETSGLQRGKVGGKVMTEDQHAAMMRRLADFLSYLDPRSLLALAEEVLESATGPRQNQWPSELLIRQMAEGKERRPRELASIVTSWLASVEGPKAEAGGYLVQLYRHLRKHRRPVLPYDLTQIKAEAERDQRRLRLVRERLDIGIAGAEDRDWLSDWVEDETRARSIIETARAQRAARQSSEGEAA